MCPGTNSGSVEIDRDVELKCKFCDFRKCEHKEFPCKKYEKKESVRFF